jgi:hypothetical protein
MPLPARSWTVSCRACDLVIGAVVGGRFVHDPACTRPLAIGAGLLRCCQCGGRLAADSLPLTPPVDADLGDEAADEQLVEQPAVPPLRFTRAPGAAEARRRL